MHVRGAVLLLAMALASCFRYGLTPADDASPPADTPPRVDLVVTIDMDGDAAIDTQPAPDSRADSDAGVDSTVDPDAAPPVDVGVDSTPQPDLAPPVDLGPDSTPQPDLAPPVDAGPDSTPDPDAAIVDLCPQDPNKLVPGICGCGVPDTDSDNDGAADCVDGCPADFNKTAPGACGCGAVELDANNNGVCETWTLPLWSYRRTIIIGSRTPTATLSDFPVLIDIDSDTSLRDHARSDGHDIRFTTETGTPLQHQTETYDPVTGSLLAWVKLPSLDTSSDTLLLLYYGNAAATADPSVTTVWSNAYTAVWHLGETGSGAADEFVDSSGNGNHAQGGAGDKKGTPARQPGKIGYGQDGDGSDDFISTPIQLSGQSLLTLTAWFHLRATNNTVHPGLLGQNDAVEIGFYWNDRINVWTPSVTTKCPGKNIISACTPDFSLNTWMHLAVVFDGTSATLYVDGVEKHVAVCTGVGSSSYFLNLMGRVFEATGNSLDGMLDEVRVASTPRSAAWIATQHATQSDPASFYTLGPEQLVP